MKNLTLAAVLAASLLFAVGCNYFKITDPATDRTYYTEKYDKESGGAIRFVDAKTGSTVTVQNSEVTKISKESFRAAVGPQK